MTWSAFATLIVLNLVGSLSPGPDTFFLLRLAVRSRSHALFGVAGIVTGLSVWVTLTVVGAAAVLSAYPQVLGIIQLVGGTYLTYMGLRLLRTASKELIDARAHRFASSAQPLPDAVSPADTLGSHAQVYRQGLATNLSNPKVVMYFAAILAPLMPAHPSPLLAVGIVVAILVQTLLTFGLVCVVVSTEKVRKAMLRAGVWFDLLAGVVFTIVGITLVVEGITHLIG